MTMVKANLKHAFPYWKTQQNIWSSKTQPSVYQVFHRSLHNTEFVGWEIAETFQSEDYYW